MFWALVALDMLIGWVGVRGIAEVYCVLVVFWIYDWWVLVGVIMIMCCCCGVYFKGFLGLVFDDWYLITCNVLCISFVACRGFV